MEIDSISTKAFMLEYYFFTFIKIKYIKIPNAQQFYIFGPKKPGDAAINISILRQI